MRSKITKIFWVVLTISFAIFRACNASDKTVIDDPLALAPDTDQSELATPSPEATPAPITAPAPKTGTPPIVIKGATTATVPFERQANTVFNYISMGNYGQAEQFLNTELQKQTRTRGGSFYVYVVLGRAISDYWELPVEPQMMDWLNKWRSQYPDSIWPYLVEYEYYRNVAWSLRGQDSARKTSKEQWQGYRQKLELAIQALEQAIELDPWHPVALLNVLEVGKEIGLERDIYDSYFEAAVEVVPFEQVVYTYKMAYLLPQWQGKGEESLEFARQVFRQAPPDTALPYTLVLAYQRYCKIARNCSKFLQTPQHWSEITQACDRLMTDFPKAESYFSTCAGLAEKADKVDLAYQWINDGLKHTPGHPSLQAWAGRLKQKL